jgi:hypothetical protein
MVKFQEFGENPDRKVNRDFGVRGVDLYEIATRKSRIAEIDIGIRKFGVCVGMRFLASRVSNSRYAKTR